VITDQLLRDLQGESERSPGRDFVLTPVNPQATHIDHALNIWGNERWGRGSARRAFANGEEVSTSSGTSSHRAICGGSELSVSHVVRRDRRGDASGGQAAHCCRDAHEPRVVALPRSVHHQFHADDVRLDNSVRARQGMEELNGRVFSDITSLMVVGGCVDV